MFMKQYFTIFSFFIYMFFTQTIAADIILCPVDHKMPEGTTFNLEYEFGNKFQPELPTIIVVSDAQQFYVRKGNMASIRKELFGNEYNVLGIIPRSNNEKLREMVYVNGLIDWKKAYRIFSSYQMAYDIEFIRINLLNETDGVYLYGQSGGAYLITEYLSLFPDAPIEKVFIASAVNPAIQRKLSLLHDTFHDEFLSKYPSTKSKLDHIIAEKFFDRKLIANLIQRQNFFVARSDLDRSRIELIDKLYEKDHEYIDYLIKEYQIDTLNVILGSDHGIPIRVRIFEFIKPLSGLWNADNTRYYPDIENSLFIAEPLFEAGIEAVENFNKTQLRKFEGEVFILSGRYDHIADYRASIYLGGIFPYCRLLIVEDDHMFASLKSENRYSAIIMEFFKNTIVPK